MREFPKQQHQNLLIGPSESDDAGVFKVSDDLALVQTLDFLTPIVDDAYDYGRIAAANSLSDVYAMGGKPVTAMNILAFPDDKLTEEVLADILRGAADICAEAGVAVVGGHSVSDPELKFGLSVTGTLDPRQKIFANSGVEIGDRLILTKPLGTGLISNALMNSAASEEQISAMTAVMTRLNRNAAEVARECGANAATDITGFGLLGHACKMAKASGVTIEINASSLPVIEGAMDIAKSGSYFSGGERRNLSFVEQDLIIHSTVEESYKRLATDPQTSGGLLVSLPEARVEEFSRNMKERGENAWDIGFASDRADVLIVLAS
ncbi:MAG TPA: selenide, water dikinase SelD [Bacteroidetes bacterium]|nr:selenide, water dikinase [bacterium BMS3Bbin04]HDO64779.1 selenide, water dikinase SelD [Bacteroidota bacterium]HEX03904.1 selenide, water dikinase SelD [Bacteroidota bacterium]